MKCYSIGISLTISMCLGMTYGQEPKCNLKGFQLIPKLDCKGYYICVFGKPVEMPDCPKGSVFSSSSNTCVPENSIYDDCTYSRINYKSAMRRNTFAALVGPLTIEERCARDGGLIPNPSDCHSYYNCSHKYDVVPRFFEQYLQECPYPELFNTETMACDHFENVRCGARVEVKNGCNYRQNMCGSAHCIPCGVWLPRCEGKSDGIHAHEMKLWSPFYAQCYKGRTIAEKRCPADADGRTQLFHPERNQCVSLDYIPQEHGGMMPNCTDKKDGFYPDEFGRCNQYAICKNGKFLNVVKCPTGEVFDASLNICLDASKVCGPCGTKPGC